MMGSKWKHQGMYSGAATWHSPLTTSWFSPMYIPPFVMPSFIIRTWRVTDWRVQLKNLEEERQQEQQQKLSIVNTSSPVTSTKQPLQFFMSQLNSPPTCWSIKVKWKKNTAGEAKEAVSPAVFSSTSPWAALLLCKRASPTVLCPKFCSVLTIPELKDHNKRSCKKKSVNSMSPLHSPNVVPPSCRRFYRNFTSIHKLYKLSVTQHAMVYVRSKSQCLEVHSNIYQSCKRSCSSPGRLMDIWMLFNREFPYGLFRFEN